jgi:y4mF family transcriptional regulator
MRSPGKSSAKTHKPTIDKAAPAKPQATPPASAERPAYTRELSAAVRRQRKALGLTQIELGRYAGCGADFIYDLENGKPTLRLDKLLDVLATLGLQLVLESGKQRLRISEKLA